jgi:hypothetical protein
MLNGKRLAFVGGGNMAEAMIRPPGGQAHGPG